MDVDLKHREKGIDGCGFKTQREKGIDGCGVKT